jgi:hypothetical protein
MGFFKRGKKDDEPEASAAGAPPEASAGEPAGRPARELIAALGSADRATRRSAAVELTARPERTAMRPLMTAYTNYGDPEVLEALRRYGSELTPAVTRDAADLSTIGVRRARVLDMLAATGDEECIRAARESLNDVDRDIHVRAAVALVQLGDLTGIDVLSADLTLTDAGLRTTALSALRELQSIPQADKAISAHVDRYLADTGAIPTDIEVSAPRLDNRDVSMTGYVYDHVLRSPHDLTIIIGSEAINMATRREGQSGELPGHDVVYSTRRMAPEEQLAALNAARDRAIAKATGPVVLIGALPGPMDSPPLPHFLTRPGGASYNAKILIVDPHEVRMVMDWYRYVKDDAEVPTHFEVILAVSNPTASAISEEEYMIYQLLPEERHEDFIRALLAHM